ncbi:CPA2 family monovalent cation:H+ antiporter-2 [Bacteroides sp. HPS0048]|uniref:cation:proton antiporter n=1 Tax=Bacteroides sp. HPS0048 TaxID=1078089 RepID=UPI000364E695|nr:cation:proton antiporter [Bacteroides sp. HPS0048]EOA53198.1 CPA2 family monovalent cation:H+ antiporter-2 [Bacteroides sp. HPS0048]
MSHLPTLIADLALILISASIITLLFKWLKQPLVLGYIVAGLLAGPYVHIFPTVGDIANINIWAEIGVVFLLFALGLEFSFKKLINVGSTAFITATTEVISMLLIGYMVGYLLGWGTMNSIFLGGMLSMSSTTIIIKAFDDLGLRSQRFTGIVFGTLVVEDLIAILMMVLLSTMAVSKDFVGEELLVSVLKVVFFLILWFLIGIFILPAFLKKAKKLMNNETLLIVSLGLCLGMVVLATYTGFSAALGAFIMGSILAETIEAEHIEHIIQPVKDLFGAIFFVSVGMLVNPAVLVEYAWPVIIITLVTIIGKAIFSSLGVLLSGESLNISIKSGFSLAQIGEFAFIIAGLGVSLKVLDPFISPIIVAVSVITTFTTPYFIRLANPFAEWLYKVLPPKVQEMLARYASGKKTVNHDSDWKKLLKNIVGRVIIYSVLLTAIWLLSVKTLYPAVSELFTPVTIWVNLAMCLVTLLLMTPFLWALISNKYNSSAIFLKLWEDENYNHGRLVALVLFRVSVAIFFISAVVISYFHLNIGIGVVIAVAVVALILILREDLTQYSRLETHFLTNLNLREEVAKKHHPLKTSFNSEFNNKDIELTSVVVSPYSRYIGKSLGELSFRQEFGVNVVAIVRGDLKIYIPKSSERIYPQDKLAVVGTDGQLQKFRDEIESPQGVPDTEEMYQEMNLHSFTVNEAFHFLDKSIVQSRLGERYDSIVVAIERNGALVPLDKDVTFLLGDLVWFVGEREKIRQLF